MVQTRLTTSPSVSSDWAITHQQTTLAQTVACQGIGLHSGAATTVTLHPAAHGTCQPRLG
jgi:hypothetical protein